LRLGSANIFKALLIDRRVVRHKKEVIQYGDGVQPESLLHWLLDPSTKCMIGTWESVNVREITPEDQRRFLIQSHGLKSASLTY
jgi:hypothetical protein